MLQNFNFKQKAMLFVQRKSNGEKKSRLIDEREIVFFLYKPSRSNGPKRDNER